MMRALLMIALLSLGTLSQFSGEPAMAPYVFDNDHLEIPLPPRPHPSYPPAVPLPSSFPYPFPAHPLLSQCKLDSITHSKT